MLSPGVRKRVYECGEQGFALLLIAAQFALWLLPQLMWCGLLLLIVLFWLLL